MPTNHDETLHERYEREHRQMEKSTTTLKADEKQDWKGMDGATAFLLIQRHADGRDEVGEMMTAWLRTNTAPQPAQPLTDDPCPGCQVGKVCRTPKCGRLKLPVDHPLRTGVKHMSDQSPHAFEIGPLAPVADPVNDSLDDMAELALHWQRKRLNGRVPVAIRAGMILLAKEIVAHVATDEAIPNNLESQPNG